MKRMLSAVLLVLSLLIGSQAFAQSDQTFINNCTAQLQLTGDQVPKFTDDYNSFQTQLAAIKKKFNNNLLLAKGETDKLVAQTDKSIKTYLSEAQFKAYKKLYNSGQLGKNSTVAVVPGTTTTTPAQTQVQPQSSAGIKTQPQVKPVSNSVDVTNLGIEPLVDPLKDLMKLTPDQVIKLKADAKAFDNQLALIEKNNANNPAGKDAAVKTLTDQTVKKMDVYLNDDQLLKFVSACHLQQNIILGKNLSPDQKALVNKMRNDYQMNDAQILMVVLVWVEGRVKLEAIKANASKDPQAAVVLTQNTLKAMDAKLKNVMTPAQYDAMHDDVVAQMKK